MTDKSNRFTHRLGAKLVQYADRKYILIDNTYYTTDSYFYLFVIYIWKKFLIGTVL